MHAIVQGHATWIVAVVIFFESMGLPLPGESLLIASAIYAATHGGLQIEWVLFFAAIGAIMGDNAGYLIGHMVGRRALQRWGGKIGLTEKRLILGDYLFARHGPKVVFFGRFIAFLRTLAALMAGATRMPWPKFLLWNALGGICWTVGYGSAAYVLGDHIHAFLGPVGLTLGAIALVCVIWFVVFVNRHETQLTEQAERALKEKAPGTSSSPPPTAAQSAEGD
jgi:membrane protein DedA with SNARE-associated domain